MDKDVVAGYVFRQLTDRLFFCAGNCGRDHPVYTSDLYLVDSEQVPKRSGIGFYCGECCERFKLDTENLWSLRDMFRELRDFNGARDHDAKPLTVRSLAMAEEGIFHPRPPKPDEKNVIRIQFKEHEELGLIYLATWNNDTVVRGQGNDITPVVRLALKADPTVFVKVESDADPHIFMGEK